MCDSHADAVAILYARRLIQPVYVAMTWDGDNCAVNCSVSLCPWACHRGSIMRPSSWPASVGPGRRCHICT
jgi:hypothetical protein